MSVWAELLVPSLLAGGRPVTALKRVLETDARASCGLSREAPSCAQGHGCVLDSGSAGFPHFAPSGKCDLMTRMSFWREEINSPEQCP